MPRASRAWACLAKIATQVPGDDQKRELQCLHIDAFAGWLFTLNPKMVKPELRNQPLGLSALRVVAGRLQRRLGDQPGPHPQ